MDDVVITGKVPADEPQRSLRVLAVEDDPGDQMLIQESFAQHAPHHRLTMVDDGEEALNFVHRRAPYTDAAPPDIIVLDLNLPKYDGRAVLADIRSTPALTAIPVVIFSTSTAPDDIRGTYELHANAYITKPTDFDEFAAVINSINDFFARTARLPASVGA
ncbi:response regulator [Spirillospora sp. NPDC000708]